MSLLVIHCPLKPFAGSASKSEESLRADQFAWCLCENPAENPAVGLQGISSAEKMPYADEVLVLIPTLPSGITHILSNVVPAVPATSFLVAITYAEVSHPGYETILNPTQA